MTNRGVLLCLLMEDLGIDPELRAFADRLRLQKSVYLLQELGLPTAFSYNWYLRGPYSPSLTAVAFEEVARAHMQGDVTHKGYSLSQNARQKVRALRRIADEPNTMGLPAEYWLELLASMHFYRHKMYFPPGERSRLTDAAWLHGQLPAAKRTVFTQAQAVQAAEALRAASLW